jgi:Heparinase II/III-like protein/Heparinase II/III N-terminus
MGRLQPREQLRGAVRDALPSVRAFERELEGLGAQGRERLLARAAALAEHRFDLLGSGPTALGEQIDWQLDFKSGRRWPMEHISRLPIVYGDGSDIKVPWELSRFQHLPLLAGAHRLTGERPWLDEIAAQLTDWIAANPVEFGANWACTMDVAIRATNWVATLALIADAAAGEPWLEGVLESLLLHGRFIRSHLEYAPVRSNHYLSDVVGLLPVAALFSGGAEGSEWAEWAAVELVGELAHQVREDGCDHEASIPYHRLVTELFICGTDAADALAPGRIPASHRAKLERMLGFVGDYTRPDSLAPQVGDSDDGRFLPLGDYASADPRSHLHLFAQAGREYRPAQASAAYPHGGYWIMRMNDLYVLVRCGDVGVGGLGSHAHNDALSFEFAAGGQPLVVDPGSYLYTADPAERNRFRSTAFHITLQVDGAEQNPLSEAAVFALEDRRRAEALRWETSSTGALFSGRHRGYAELESPAIHSRTIELDGGARVLKIADAITSAGAHDLDWTFPLAPCSAQAEPGRASAVFESGVLLEIESPGLDFRIEPGWLSPSYGRRIAVPFVRAHRRSEPGEDVTELLLGVKDRRQPD